MRKHRRLLPLAALALAIAAAGWAGSTARGESNAGDPIVLGASLPLTGDFSQPGTSAHRGYLIWQSFVNKAGGLLGRQVKLDIVDDGSSQKTVVTDYNRLINHDHVDLLLGTFSSLLNFPASAVAEKNHMVYAEPAGGAPDLFSRGYKYLFFCQPAVSIHQADLFSQWIAKLPNHKKLTAAYITGDDPFAQPVVENVQKQLKKAGIKTVYGLKVYPEATTTGFDALVNGIKSSGADIVVQGAVFDDAIGVVRQMKQVGYNPKILFQTSAPSEGSQFAKGVGGKNTQGIFYAVSWSDQAKTPENQRFVKEYERRYHGPPPEDAADAFGTAQVVEAAVKATHSLDQEKIRDWLHGHSVNTVEGVLNWDKTGAPQGQFLVAQWQNGKTQVVLPKSIATSKKIVYPKPNWK